MLSDLLGRRLLIVTGKGGVGKSTIAAALALVAANQGKRVLVVDVDAKGTIADRFETAPIAFAPREVMPGISLMAMDTEASLAEYVRLNLKVPILGRLGPLARALDFVATAAPGVREILTIGKICWEVRESIEGRAGWDLVVVDAAATGHVIAQLGAPDAISDMVAVGPVRNQTEWMSDLLSDPAVTALNVVTTPEEMPVAETIDLVGRARRELRVPLGAVIVNRVLPELFTHADELIFDALTEPPVVDRLTRRAGEGAGAVLEAARLAVSMRRSRVPHLERLREDVDLPLMFVPYLFARSQGRRETALVADALTAELGL
ncbi:MAG: ArsA family ATPase [Acidimicrobiia bacterium]|nr:ArsA family ATPase [Acidimicrobiia bacterium]